MKHDSPTGSCWAFVEEKNDFRLKMARLGYK